MKTKIISRAALFLAALFFSLPALAMETELGVDVNYFDPTNDVLRDFYKSGVSYGLNNHLWWGNGFGLGTDFEYFSATRAYAGDHFVLNAFSLESCFLYSLRGDRLLRPYLGAGISLNYGQDRNKDGGKTARDFEFGYLLNAGLEFKVKWFRPYIQIGYRTLPGAEQGIDLSGWITGLGINFGLPAKKPN